MESIGTPEEGLTAPIACIPSVSSNILHSLPPSGACNTLPPLQTVFRVNNGVSQPRINPPAPPCDANCTKDAVLRAVPETPCISEYQGSYFTQAQNRALNSVSSGDRGDIEGSLEIYDGPASKQPPTREIAEIALKSVEALLHPPRNTGRGYKPCKLDSVTRKRYEAITACLRFYLRSGANFTDASWNAAIGAGRGEWYARTIRLWTQRFVATGCLPMNNFGVKNHSMLEDEDIASEIRFYLRDKGKYITAEDLTGFVNTPEVQQHFGLSKPVSKRTARRWLRRMGYQWRRHKAGLYYDGHEREDVVHYRQQVFLPKWKALEPFMPSWDHDSGLEIPPVLQGTQQEVTIWFHNATTAYAHDRCDVYWVPVDEHATPRKKGQGLSVMFADYISARHGFLASRDGRLTTRKILQAGKNREGYLTNVDICQQFRSAVKLAKQEYPKERHLFVYDNARIHTKHPPTAPSARSMTKGESLLRVQTVDSQGNKIKVRMDNPQFPNGSEQELYLPGPEGMFKGMEVLLQERGYNTTGLKAQCQNFKCVDPSADCCCRRILFRIFDTDNGPKSILESLAEELGTEVIFLPKYHCELNPIEQCWGYAKRLYRKAPPSSRVADVEKNMLQALSMVPIESIRRFVARSRRFIDAYAEGLDGPNAAASDWVKRRFRRHRSTPEHVIV
ncbi:Protein unc-13 homolog B [Rhizoctonia solani]|uniref:Protein unc-13 homolog B n=1 Tax=Rhizoctonia solani TaxID=456999 RepID=A0A0K6FTW9_9AGAM|nr:Protein unc-13 homolog B [Rhizoctonia solani]